ncbi:MAG TPA: DMT family transporter [Drouetiella sp.]
MSSRTQSFIPALAVLCSIISLCVGTSFGKSLFPVVGAAGTASIRVILSCFVLMAFFRPWREPLSFKSAKNIAMYGAVLGCMNSVFYESIQRLPLGIAIAIEFTGPLAVAIASSRRTIDFVWIALAIVGLAFLLPIAPGAVSLDPVGISLAFTAAALWACYIILGKRMSNMSAGQATSYGVLAASVVLLPVGVTQVGARILDPHVLLSGFILCIASSALPYTLEMYAMKKLPKNTFSILLSMEPAVGALSGMIVLHESLTMLQWAAVLSVMVASIGTTLTSRSASAAPVVPDTVKVTAQDVPADVL